MAFSKIEMDGSTLIDLSQDTADASSVLNGYAAHNAKGEAIIGEASGGVVHQDQSGALVFSKEGGNPSPIVENKWHRPASWPNYDLYDFSDNEECIFFTYETVDHNPNDWIGISIGTSQTNGGYIVERGFLENGVWTVEESNSVEKSTAFYQLLPTDRDYTVFKAKPDTNIANNHITFVAMSPYSNYGGNSSYSQVDAWRNIQKCIERYSNLPYIASGRALTNWGGRFLVSDTFLNAGGWTNFQSIMNDCPRMENFIIKNFNKNTTFMYNFFGGAKSLEYINLEDWQIDGKLTSTGLSMMFYNNSCLKNARINHWDITGATNLTQMFTGCTKLKNIEVDKWDTSSVTNLSYMFQGTGITHIDLSKWDTSKVTSFSRLFRDCNFLQTSPINNFDFSSATDTAEMLYNCFNITGDVVLKNIPTVGTNAFYNCRNVNNYIFDVESVPTLTNTNAFANNNFANGQRIKFPSDLVDEAKGETNWSTYADYIVAISTE